MSASSSNKTPGGAAGWEVELVPVRPAYRYFLAGSGAGVVVGKPLLTGSGRWFWLCRWLAAGPAWLARRRADPRLRDDGEFPIHACGSGSRVDRCLQPNGQMSRPPLPVLRPE